MPVAEAQLNEARKKAIAIVDSAQIDFLKLDTESISKADTFLKQVYKDWKEGQLDDLTADAIGNIFEAEPIHHLMSVSIYPLCDLWFYIDSGDTKAIEKFKSEIS